jgi:hypothetical protein
LVGCEEIERSRTFRCGDLKRVQPAQLWQQMDEIESALRISGGDWVEPHVKLAKILVVP